MDSWGKTWPLIHFQEKKSKKGSDVFGGELPLTGVSESCLRIVLPKEDDSVRSLMSKRGIAAQREAEVERVSSSPS